MKAATTTLPTASLATALRRRLRGEACPACHVAVVLVVPTDFEGGPGAVPRAPSLPSPGPCPGCGHVLVDGPPGITVGLGEAWRDPAPAPAPEVDGAPPVEAVLADDAAAGGEPAVVEPEAPADPVAPPPWLPPETPPPDLGDVDPHPFAGSDVEIGRWRRPRRCPENEPTEWQTTEDHPSWRRIYTEHMEDPR